MNAGQTPGLRFDVGSAEERPHRVPESCAGAQHYVPGDQYADVHLGCDGSLERWRVPEVLFSRSE
jgi:hypothetical protein